MKKRLAGVVACMLLCSIVSAAALEQRAISKYPKLTFSDTTATCYIRVAGAGEEIDLTMELWEGNTIMYKWYGSGSPSVELIRRATVRKGKSYTPKASGTVGGEAFVVTPVTRTCPN